MADVTTTNFERAAETLAAIARIPSLQGGVVGFGGPSLAGGEWFREGDHWPEADELSVPVPSDRGDDETLLADCRVALHAAMAEIRAELVHAVGDCSSEYAERYERRLAAWEAVS